MMLGLFLLRDGGCSVGLDERSPYWRIVFDFFRSIVRMAIRKEVIGKIF